MPPDMTKRRSLMVVGMVVVVAVLAMAAGLLLALRLGDIEDELAAAENLIDRAGEELTDGRIGDATRSLTEARLLLTDANSDLHTATELALFGGLPGLRHNLEVLRDTVGISLVLVARAGAVLDASGPLTADDGSLEVPLSDGAIPLDAVQAVRREVDALIDELPLAGEDPGPLVLGRIADLRSRLDEEVARRRAQLVGVGRGLELVEELAGGNGPRRYLIAVANTAEMRGSGGMILNYGVMEGADGRFTLGEFGRIDEVALAEPVPADLTDVPEDYLRRWAGFDPLLRWRNANLSPDFEVVAPVLEHMYEQATGVPVDGVIQVDPDGLAAILAGTGPVDVPELGRVTADNVVALTLNEAYFRFPGIEERSDVLENVAEAAFDRLATGRYSTLRPLAEALVEAADEGHLRIHARRTEVQGLYRRLGADGALPDTDEILALTVQNVSANKLDWYLGTAVEVTGARPVGSPGELQVTITLTNTAPPGATQPRYIFGPNVAGQVAGEYRGAVSLYVPRGTTIVAVEGDPTRTQPRVFAEDDRTVVGWTHVVPAGATRSVVLRLTTPSRQPEETTWTLVPVPRIRPTEVTVDVDGGDGTRVRSSGPLATNQTLWYRSD